MGEARAETSRAGQLLMVLLAADIGLWSHVDADTNSDKCPTTIPNGYMVVETLKWHGKFVYCDYTCNQGYWKRYTHVICSSETGEFTVEAWIYCQFHAGDTTSAEDPSQPNTVWVAVSSTLGGGLVIVLLLIIAYSIRKRVKTRNTNQADGDLQLGDMSSQPGFAAGHPGVAYIVTAPPPYTAELGDSSVNMATVSPAQLDLPPPPPYSEIYKPPDSPS